MPCYAKNSILQDSRILNICFLALLSADAACTAGARSWKSGVNLSNIVPKWCIDQQLQKSTFLSQPKLTFLSKTKFASKVVEL